MVFRYRTSYRIGKGRYIGNSFSGSEAVVATFFDLGFQVIGAVLGTLFHTVVGLIRWTFRKPLKGALVILAALAMGSWVSRGPQAPQQPATLPQPAFIVAQPIVSPPPPPPANPVPVAEEFVARDEPEEEPEAAPSKEPSKFVPDPALQKVIAARRARQQKIAAQKQRAQYLMERQLQAEAEAARASGGGFGGGREVIGGGVSGICGAPTQDGSICQRRVSGGGRCYQH